MRSSSHSDRFQIGAPCGNVSRLPGSPRIAVAAPDRNSPRHAKSIRGARPWCGGVAAHLAPAAGRLAIAASVIFLAGIDLGRSQGVNTSADNDACRSIAEPAARAQCNEMSKMFGNPTNAQRTTLPGEWRLVRTPNPRGGIDAISVSHTAEIQKSDPNFAGIMLRCDQGQMEALVIVLEPYPPSAIIELTITRHNLPSKYRAGVVPPGVMVRLPADAATTLLAAGHQDEELTVSLASESTTPTKGVVKLSGLDQAVGTLRGLCTAP
jgi:hypothetical protein